MISIAKTGGETFFTLNFGLKFFTENINGVSIEMIAVKGGTFQMGSNDREAGEKPVHKVTVSDFYIGKYEVTQAQWQAIMGSNPSNFKGDNLPVENVSWNDAQEFIQKLNSKTTKTYRLPTEAEWEYAAGASTGSSTGRTKWAGTNEESSLGAYAWYDANSNSTTHFVGSKLPNGLGIYDMSGNVREWCNDWYGSYRSRAQTNPSGPSGGSYRVLRGGGWSNYALNCRVASRNSSTPGYRHGSLGFRLVSSR